MIKFFFIED